MTDNNKYQNLSTSDHPATIILLVDISGSMKAFMPDGNKRIDVAKDAIQTAYAKMIERSLRQGKIHPRYRVGMIAYSTELYDVYGELGSIVTIDKLKDEGIPSISPQQTTNMAKAFRYAYKVIEDDLKTWPQEWLEKCPPPLVINLTDCEFDEDNQDPVEFARKLQEISVPDGNVLVENIFITDQIKLPSTSVLDWKGYKFSDSTGDPYGDKLLSMSSPIPASYAQLMSEQAGLKIREGTAMMFPGINKEFIKTGFAMSNVTGGQIKPSMRPRTPE